MRVQSDVLVVIAHPDDEIFVSGTICLCAERGFRIALACVTDGDGGDRDLLPANFNIRLAEVRRRELELSATALGIDHVIFLEEPDIPAGIASVYSWDHERVAGSISRLIEQFQPQLILTHGPRGGYGHPAHRMVHDCVMKSVRRTAFSGSVFSFCGQVKHAFFSWHFEGPSDVVTDVRAFLRRRSASLAYHQSQTDYFLPPYFPRSLRKWLSACFGYVFFFKATGRMRVPIATPSRFFRRFPVEGLMIQKRPEPPCSHFFTEHYQHDPRIKIVR